MAADVTDRLWEIADIAKLVEDAETARTKRRPYKKASLMHLDALTSYGMEPVARFSIVDDFFEVEVTNSVIAAQECCIYAFVVGGQIVRIGSSKGKLSTRLRAWRNDVSKALQGRKSPTQPPEAAAWRALLEKPGYGTVFARAGTRVTTPVGEISTFLNEECALIERYRPSINRSWR